MPQMFPIYFSIIYILICSVVFLFLVNMFWAFQSSNIIENESLEKGGPCMLEHKW